MIRVTLHRPQGPGATIAVEHMRRAFTFVETIRIMIGLKKTQGRNYTPLPFPESQQSAKD